MKNYKVGLFIKQIILAMRSNPELRGKSVEQKTYDMAVYQVIRQRRKKWLKGRMHKVAATADKLNRIRYANNKTKQNLRSFRRKSVVKLPKNLLAHRYRHSELLSGLVPSRREKWTPLLKRTGAGSTAEIEPENFSFIDNPNQTLIAIKRIAEAECSCIDSYVHFKDNFCMDIGPYLVLSEVWPFMAHIFRGGRMYAPVQKMVETVGLRKPLGMALRGLDNLDDVWAFPVQRRRPTGSSKSQQRFLAPQSHEKVTDRFCDAIESWLSRPEIDQTLTIDGRVWIAGIINELLDNAERHSDPIDKDGEWSIAGFMARRQEGDQIIYRCYISFMSVGATISESLRTCLPRVEKDINDYCDLHAGKIGVPSRDTLRTLFALQDTVTRDPEADANGRGGFGFQEVMHFVHELGGTPKVGMEPRITIISGSSCIQLRPPHILGVRHTDKASPRVLWCNVENSHTLPPDPAFVFDLQERLAGTVISVAFTLDPDYLNETV